MDNSPYSIRVIGRDPTSGSGPTNASGAATDAHGNSTSLSPVMNQYGSPNMLSPRTPALGSSVVRRRVPSAARELSAAFEKEARLAEAPRSDPQAPTFRDRFAVSPRLTAPSDGSSTGIASSLAARARRFRERSVPNLGLAFQNGAQKPPNLNHKRSSRSISQDVFSAAIQNNMANETTASASGNSLRAISLGNLKASVMLSPKSKDKSRFTSPKLASSKKGFPRLLAPFQIDKSKSSAASSSSSASFAQDTFPWLENRTPEPDPDDVPIRVIKAGNIMLESMQTGKLDPAPMPHLAKPLPADPAPVAPFWTKPPSPKTREFDADEVTLKDEPFEHRSNNFASGDLSMPKRGSISSVRAQPRQYGSGSLVANAPTAHRSSDGLLNMHSLAPKSALDPSSNQRFSTERASLLRVPTDSGTSELLNTSAVSSALAELAASLRWSSKFPEGAHMTRARSGALSRRLSGIGMLEDGEQRSHIHSRRQSTLAVDQSNDIGDLGMQKLMPPERGSVSSATSRSSGRLSTGWTRRLGTKLRPGFVPDAETRQGLRFLAKTRHEIEAEDNGTFFGYYDHGSDGQLLAQPGFGAGSSNRFSGRRAKWNTFKLVLIVSILLLLAYGTTCLIGALLTWARTWARADVTVVADPDILIFVTLAAFLCVFTGVVGLCGALLNSRPILAIYSFLLWPTLISILVVGYTSYKRANLRLDRKLNMAWSRYFDDLARLRLQNNLHCCGYYSPLHQATFSRKCYPRTALPGCKGKLYRYEMSALTTIYKVAFSLVFVHLFAIVASLLCSNHVNFTFGKGLTPRQYRLDMTHVRRNALSIMKVLAESGGKRTGSLESEDSTMSMGFTRELSVHNLAETAKISFDEIPFTTDSRNLYAMEKSEPQRRSHSQPPAYDEAPPDFDGAHEPSIRSIGAQGEFGDNVRGLNISMSVSQNAAARLREFRSNQM